MSQLPEGILYVHVNQEFSVSNYLQRLFYKKQWLVFLIDIFNEQISWWFITSNWISSWNTSNSWNTSLVFHFPILSQIINAHFHSILVCWAPSKFKLKSKSKSIFLIFLFHKISTSAHQGLVIMFEGISKIHFNVAIAIFIKKQLSITKHIIVIEH